MIFTTNYSSPLGNLTLASKEEKLIGIWIENQKYHGETLFPELEVCDILPIFSQTKEWLDDYFAKKNPSFPTHLLAPCGSPFRQEVWKILLEIPYGEVITYGEISKTLAKKFGRKRISNQAVGGAVGHNPITILIPCHRVVGKNGNLTGYAGGIEKKIHLLEHEGISTENFSMPKA
ncbi:methylated-DNA-[protein]-cysteine S-methyltransferase [Pilibacter termitis]|uniref:Methylated-DNA--protein-cysteine methyltransferase n=1 Tax=Pilibacter termitis TaxID=263852 RepID=A0A1T4RGH3_9ENTE|nr:methylated-DNA--[protein]-cysteine S-methyltransferase [Pilibacter termitis]SKA15140.1 methylated-DNA-[protein]-cysteine S-methyltransferase [Pilibacter termitis]